MSPENESFVNSVNSQTGVTGGGSPSPFLHCESGCAGCLEQRRRLASGRNCTRAIWGFDGRRCVVKGV